MTLRPARRLDGIERTLIRQIFDAAPPGAINLGLGQPDLPTPPHVALAGVAAIAAGRTGYTSTAGDPELRAAVARRYGRITPGPDNVLITVGSQEAMLLGCMALVDPGDEILFPDPGYPAYAMVARLIGAQGVAYPLRPERGFRIATADVLERIGERTRLVILCTPSNPTGCCHSRAELEELLPELAARRIPWLADEIYAGFSYETDFVSPAETHPGDGLLISGVSKDLSMTGWRVGWLLGPEEIIRRATAAHQDLVTCAPSLSQRAALAAFSPAGVEARRRLVERFARRRSLMAEELSRLPDVRFALPEGAFYFFVDVSAHGDSRTIAQRILEQQGVITIPGIAFGSHGEGHLRISFAAGEDDIRAGVRRIAEELGRRRG